MKSGRREAARRRLRRRFERTPPRLRFPTPALSGSGAKSLSQPTARTRRAVSTSNADGGRQGPHGLHFVTGAAGKEPASEAPDGGEKRRSASTRRPHAPDKIHERFGSAVISSSSPNLRRPATRCLEAFAAPSDGSSAHNPRISEKKRTPMTTELPPKKRTPNVRRPRLLRPSHFGSPSSCPSTTRSAISRRVLIRFAVKRTATSPFSASTTPRRTARSAESSASRRKIHAFTCFT